VMMRIISCGCKLHIVHWRGILLAFKLYMVFHVHMIFDVGGRCDGAKWIIMDIQGEDNDVVNNPR